MGRVAQIIYGHGHHLGNFEVFATSLARSLSPSYGRDRVLVRHIVRRDDFFSYLTTPPLRPGDKIAELHVFAHSIGGGAFIAYGDAVTDQRRREVFARADNAKRRVTYQEVLDAEIGAILTDDFVRNPYIRMQGSIRRSLADGATLKLWGCNAGIAGWIYSDGNGITNPADDSEPYYWRALNEQNVPKPAVAQAFANYFGRVCYGATSGSHVEVMSSGLWESTARYRSEHGRWPSGAMIHRLHPDRGNYREFHPTR
jgi:hypothetical protein